MTSVEGYSLALPSTVEAASELDLADLVGTYSALLFRVAHSVLRSRSEAEDVVQDVFVRVLEHRRSLPEVRDLRVWLIRIAWNLALDRRRRIRPDQMDMAFAETLVATVDELPSGVRLRSKVEQSSIAESMTIADVAEVVSVWLAHLHRP